MYLSDGGSDDSEIDCVSDGSLVPPCMMMMQQQPLKGGGNDDYDDNNSSCSNEEMDWSGRGGGRCDMCGRRSENVGPRRGFDHRNNICGGCCG